MTATADVLDEHGERASVCLLQFRSFGSRTAFSGPVATVRCPEHSVLLRGRLALDALELGVKALGTNPRPSGKDANGEVDGPVTFGAVTSRPGAVLYADEDGVVVLA